MPYFRQGDCLYINNERIVVDKCIGQGSQADVYRILNYDRQKKMALKHMYGYYATNPQVFHKKCTLLSKFPAPHLGLVWPLSVGDYNFNTNSFAYLMDLLSSDYKPLARAIKNREALTDSQRISLAKKLVEIFETLHRQRFIYGDISDKNIFYRFDEFGNADIRVIDCDNVTMEGHSLGLLGTGLFRAPEVLLGGNPTVSSDVHALTVAIFRLLVGTHPLDGKRTRTVPLTPETVLDNFGRHPEYIFSTLHSNEPLNETYRQRYLSLSPELRLYFDVMFCSVCLHNASKPDLEKMLKILNM